MLVEIVVIPRRFAARIEMLERYLRGLVLAEAVVVRHRTGGSEPVVSLVAIDARLCYLAVRRCPRAHRLARAPIRERLYVARIIDQDEPRRKIRLASVARLT